VTVAARDARDCALVVALKLAVGVIVLRLGFSHVSDDDFARVVIAQSFAHAPKLDPSGTSWLPFPFWVNGAAMMAFGRSLETARALALALGAISAAAPLVALRAVGVARGVAIAGVIVAMTAPWNAWLGAAMVPEASTAALVAAGAIAMGSARARVWGAAGLAMAALSRYEAWPVCAVMAVVAAAGAARATNARDRWRDVAAALVAVAAPLAWIAWNAHAHGDALHFVARVAAFRQRIGAASAPIAEKLLDYPRAIVEAASGMLPLVAVGAVALRDAEMRRRWRGPFAAAIAMLAFLVYGDVRDGAPTHHPERAIVPLFWWIAAFGADGVRAIALRYAWHRPKREMFVVGGIAAFAVAWTASVASAWPLFPARGPEETRDAQLARGRALRSRTELAITPCAYEHFALIAAYGAPERVRIAESARHSVTSACPYVAQGNE
jgi:hypothetical protein